MPEEVSDLEGLRGMIVLLEKQVHLQKEVGAIGIEYQYHTNIDAMGGSISISPWRFQRHRGKEASTY